MTGLMTRKPYFLTLQVCFTTSALQDDFNAARTGNDDDLVLAIEKLIADRLGIDAPEDVEVDLWRGGVPRPNRDLYWYDYGPTGKTAYMGDDLKVVVTPDANLWAWRVARRGEPGSAKANSWVTAGRGREDERDAAKRAGEDYARRMLRAAELAK